MRLLLLLSLLAVYAGARVRECPNICIPLRQCKSVQALKAMGTSRSINKLRRLICGSKYGDTLVCCKGWTPPTAAPPRITKSNEDIKAKRMLLPDGNCGNAKVDDKIHGGKPAKLGSLPWIVALGYTAPGKGSDIIWDCAGSLINSNYVVTAAHCFPANKKLEVIHLGDHDLKSNPDCIIYPLLLKKNCAKPHIVARPQKVIIHERYKTERVQSNDIALIRLDVTINFKTVKANVRPICLPPSNIEIKDLTHDREALAAGWGLTENNSQSDILLKVELPIVDGTKCSNESLFGTHFLASDQLCVGGVKGKDTCNKDSGGPLMIAGETGPPYILLGIVSYGSIFGCGFATPAVYTSVPRYVDWILENIDP